jgi:serine/threonine protein kinase
MDHVFPEGLRQRYLPDRLLGAGGMGEVWRARDQRLGRDVAVKLMTCEGEEARARFLREARTLASISHPSVMAALDHGEIGDRLYLVLEEVEGTSFAELPEGVDPLPAWRQIGDALEAVHRAGVLHRDVKPANAILDPRGRAVLIDFGLVIAKDGEYLTRTGAVVGTIQYVAPEVLCGEAATPAADWYAWGISLYELLEGRLPYSTSQISLVLAGQEPALPRLTGVHARSAVEETIRDLLEPDPADRPVTWDEIRHRLEGPPPPGRTATTATRAPSSGSLATPASPPSPSRRSWWPRTVAAVVLLGVAAFLVLRPRGPAAAPAPPPPNGPEVSIPSDLSDALARLERLLMTSRWHHSFEIAEWTPEERDQLARNLGDPRLPLVFQRVLSEHSAWIRALAKEATPLEVALRHPARAPFVRRIQSDTLLAGPLLASELSQVLREEIGRTSVLASSRGLLTLTQLEAELRELYLDELHGLQRDLGRLPPSLAAARTRLTSLGHVVEAERGHPDGPPKYFAWVPRESPFLDHLLTAYFRYLHSTILGAKRVLEAEPARGCQPWKEEVARAKEIVQRYGPMLPAERARYYGGLLEDAEAALRRDCSAASTTVPPDP